MITALSGDQRQQQRQGYCYDKYKYRYCLCLKDYCVFFGIVTSVAVYWILSVGGVTNSIHDFSEAAENSFLSTLPTTITTQTKTTNATKTKTKTTSKNAAKEKTHEQKQKQQISDDAESIITAAGRFDPKKMEVKKKRKKKTKRRTVTSKGDKESSSTSTSSSSSTTLNSSLWTDEDPNRSHWWEAYVNMTARTFEMITNNDNDNDNHNDNVYHNHDWCKPINKLDDDPTILYPTDIVQEEFQLPFGGGIRNTIRLKNGDPIQKVVVDGIIFIKSYKTASSTAEGVNIAIAHHVANRKYNNKNNKNKTGSIIDIHNDNGRNTSQSQSVDVDVVCRHWNRHEFAETNIHGYRKPKFSDSLLWTLVRHPRKRDLSQVFFFRLSRKTAPPNRIDILIDGIKRNFGKQTNYLKIDDNGIGTRRFRAKSNSNNDQIVSLSQNIKSLIIDQYDFIGVTERLTESLAVMTLLWNLNPTDVIVLSTKKSKSSLNANTNKTKDNDGAKKDDAGNDDDVPVYDDGGGLHKCVKILSPPIHPKIQQYLNSEYQYIQKQPDYLLYYAVVESLNRTIQLLGVSKVKERTMLLNRLQKIAELHCQHDEQTKYPCSSKGIYQGELSSKSCYVQDAGCGHQCVDRIMDLYNRGEIQL